MKPHRGSLGRLFGEMKDEVAALLADCLVAEVLEE